MSVEERLRALLDSKLSESSLTSLTDPLLNYLLLLSKWSAAYNLTAIRDPEMMVNKHILDSLAITSWLHGQRILDVGTGAGLPGIPLAIAHRQKHFTLLDSNGKKVRFLNEVKRQLDLKNIEIIQIRVENYLPVLSFDTVMSRAFSSLEQMIHWTKHLINANGIWLAMKGRYPESELLKLIFPYRVEQYWVNGIEGQRCCVIIDNPN